MSKDKNDWDNSELIGQNKASGHCTFIPYQGRETALERTEESSIYYNLINGNWKFHWVRKPVDRPLDFWKIDYNASNWAEIPVPSNWQLEGYGIPMYLNYQYPPSVKTWFPPRIDKKYNPVGSYRTEFEIPILEESPPPMVASQPAFESQSVFFIDWKVTLLKK